MEHIFIKTIRDILSANFGNISEEIQEKSLLIQYIIQKTRSANKGSKSRGSFANLYAIYVLLEDYIKKDCKNLANLQDDRFSIKDIDQVVEYVH